MKQYIGCDSHARYSVFVSVDEKGQMGTPVWADHGGCGLRDYLATLENGTPIDVEASGGWYWFMDELEKAGLGARLVNPLEAKHPWAARTRRTSWMPKSGDSAALRNTAGSLDTSSRVARSERSDADTTATRSHTTVLKNRIHAALRRYGVMNDLQDGEKTADLSSQKSRLALSLAIGRLPEQTRRATLHEWKCWTDRRSHQRTGSANS